MIELSTIRDLVAIFGVIAGFSYYVLTVRNVEKARKIQLVTQISNLASEENQKRGMQLYSLDWKDYDDFVEKYGYINNLDIFAKRYSMWSGFNTMGYFLKEELITIEQLIGALGGQTGVITMWYKYESIIRESRERGPQPELFDSWEYLVGEIEKYYKRKGYPPITYNP